MDSRIRLPPSRAHQLPNLLNGHHDEEEEYVSPTEDVDELTNGISAVEITANGLIETPTDLNDVLGEGFSFKSFATLLETQEIFVLESHFKWIFQIGNSEGLLDEKRIKVLYDKMKEWESESDEHLSVFQTVSQKLLLAVYSALLHGDTDQVGKYFDEAKKIISETQKKTGTTKQLQVYQFILLCDKLLVSGAGLLLPRSKRRSSTLTIESFKAEIEKWDSGGREVFADDLFKAVFLGMKAHISAQLGNTSKAVKLYRWAAQLDPNCFDWVHHHYTSLRRQRRENDFGAPPGEEESAACSQAIVLCPDDWIALLSNANLLEDTKRATRSLKDRQELDPKIIDILTQAQAKAPHNVSVNLKLAEAYLNKDKATDEDYTKSKMFFESCLRQWPNNSQVLHKLGKYYMTRDKMAGIKYFEDAVKADSENFPCLMDYLKEKFKMLNYLELIDLIDEFLLNYQHKKVYLGKLLALKGYLQWIEGNSTDAIRTWLQIFDNDDKSEKEKLGSYLKETLNGKHVPNQRRGLVQFKAVKALLMNTTHMAHDDKRKIEEFLTLLNADQPQPNNRIYSVRALVGEDDQNWRHRSNNSRQYEGGSVDWRSSNRHLGRNQHIASRPLGDRSSAQNRQENDSQDMDWRQRGPTVPLQSRNVELTEHEDLRVTIMANREHRDGNGAGSTARSNKQPENNSRIQLNSNGRWKKNFENENVEIQNPRSGKSVGMKRHEKNGR